jgi:hypothetical protein
MVYSHILEKPIWESSLLALSVGIELKLCKKNFLKNLELTKKIYIFAKYFIGNKYSRKHTAVL